MKKLYFISVVIIIFTANIFAFQTTSLRVIVTDRNSDAVANASVRLKGKDDFLKEINNASNKVFQFSLLKKGKYFLEVKADGFKSVSQEIKLKSGRNEALVKLAIAEIKENVEVEVNSRDKSLDSRSGAFTGVLTPQQIQDLPDDPDEFKKELENIAGPGALIRTDGFEDGKLPSKDQIASIKIIRSSFDAEFHTVGRTYIDIVTKAGGSKWSGSVSGNFNDESMNARPTFAPVRAASQRKSYNYSIGGPIVKKKASLSAFGFGNDTSNTSNIVAALPDRRVNETVSRRSRFTYNEGKLSYNLTERHPLNFAYRHSSFNTKNSGVGGINLQERASDTKSRTDRIRVTTSGLVGKRYLHEFRFQYIDEGRRTVPLNFERAIIVSGSFARGGAGSNNRNRRKHVTLSENIVFGVEKHILKFGTLVEFTKQSLDSANNQNGTFIFSSLDNFRLGIPSRFSQRLEARKINLTQFQFGTFMQDDFRLHKSFMLSLGLRYEFQNNLSDKNNFSPRVGFSWSPRKKGKTVVRGGIGVYYNWLTAQNVSTILSRDQAQPQETIVLNPGFPNPFIGGINQETINSFWRKSPNLKNPYVISSTIGVSHRLGKRTSIRATYRYEKGVHQFRSRDINAPNTNGIRPDLNFGRIVQVESSAFYVRNSLQLGFNSRLFKKVSIFGGYTLAKRISDADGIFSLPSNNFNLSLDRGVSSNDQRHRMYTYVSWTVRKGIRISTTFNFNSPRPYSITTGFDDNNDTVFNDRPNGVERNTERGVWSKTVGGDFSYTYFFGNVKKKGGSGSEMIIITSGGAMPSFNKKKRFSLQFFLSAQNVLNQTNLRGFIGVQTSPFFGSAVSAGQPRRINVGLRFGF